MRAGPVPAFFLPNESHHQNTAKTLRKIDMRKDVQQLWNLVEPHVKGAGLDLVELEWTRDPSGWLMRVYMDRPGVDPSDPSTGVPVSFEDCERVSRDISAALDVADVISHTYRLEVSSPGIDRPLRRTQDFQRFTGQKVKVRTTDAVDGRKNFSGTIRDAHDGVVEIESDGRSFQVPLEVIARAHLVPDWDAEFRKAQRRNAV
jgi:ribosome maturation factor RimP